MSDFTYTVFLIVASLVGALITLFAAGVAGVLLHDRYAQPPTAREHIAEHRELSRAA